MPVYDSEELPMHYRTRLTLALALLAALFVVPAAFARGGVPGGGGGTGGGGGGGGGGTTTPPHAAINRVAGVAACDAGTSVGVTLSSGANKQIQGVLDMTGGTNPDGTSTLYGAWTVLLSDDTNAASLGGFTTSFGPTVPSVRITNLFGGVPAGSYDLSLTFTKQAFGEPFGSTSPVLETCTAHFFVTAR